MSDLAKRLLLALTLTSTMLVQGCVTTTGSSGTNAVCAAWRPVTWSSKDTDTTIRGVKANNASQKAWCAR